MYYSFVDKDGAFSLEGYKNVFDPLYLTVITNSFKLAVICTVICLILGYPVAYILASKEYINKGFLLFLFIVPMWMNFLLRTYAWLSILENNGIINTILEFMGFEKRKLLYTDNAVLLGMVYNYLPFMILPIYTVLTKMDKSIIEAAQDLGANSRQVFRRVVFPLSLPGVTSGITMVFMPAVTTFIVSSILGGDQFMLIGNLIEHQFMRVGNWNFGSALAVIMMLLILCSNALFTVFDKTEEGGGPVL
jgi:spermidine/putrescine transport system permease protein